MATIAQNVQQVRRAVYGEEVREAIADSIEQCYADVSNAKTIADDSIENLTEVIIPNATEVINNASAAVNNANEAVERANQAVDNIDDIVLVQAEEPDSETNKLWIKPQSNEYQVPSWEEFSELKSTVESINADIPQAPTEDGEYVLKVTVQNGTPTYIWEKKVVEEEGT